MLDTAKPCNGIFLHCRFRLETSDGLTVSSSCNSFVIRRVRQGENAQADDRHYGLPAKAIDSIVRHGRRDEHYAEPRIRPFLVTAFEYRDDQHECTNHFEERQHRSKISRVA